MSATLRVLMGTPWWVFVVFAIVSWIGVRGFRSRTVRLAQVFVTPAIFIAWGLVSLVIAVTSSPLMLLYWCAAGALSLMFSSITLRLDDLDIDRHKDLVRISGSWHPLVRNLLIFAAKYGLQVAMAQHPEDRAQLLAWDVVVSGLAAGYFLGWQLRFVLKYRRTLEVSVSANSQKSVA
jgi:hypothetical protein